jgi:hypothetical protein
MKIYQYKNYNDYVESQTEANLAKLQNVYVSESSIKSVADRCPGALSIICHGTRNGAEQQYFKTFFPSAKIIGTEISITATQFEMTVQWDFHDANPEWIHSFDIVYTNSFDHAMDPLRALKTWREQLSKPGLIFLEYSPHVQSRRWDPLEINHKDLEILAAQTQLRIQNSYPSTNADNTVQTMIYVLEKTA